MTVVPANWDDIFCGPLLLIQGATNGGTWILKDPATGFPLNLTGKTARMTFRENYGSPTAFVSLTTENGGIVLGGILGTFTWLITASASALITSINGVWDVELITGPIIDRVIQGTSLLSLEV